MLGKRSRPSFGKLAGAFRSGIVDLATSPRSSLECKMNPSPSPRGLKNYEQGGVGLGIVMALDKPSHNHVSSGGEVLAKYALCGSGASSIRSNPSPIPVSPSGGSARNKRGMCGGYNDDSIDMMEGLEEELTFVTSHGPNKSVTTRVYYNDGEYGTDVGHEKKTGFSGEVGRSFGVFRISPVRLFDDSRRGSDSDFLSYCHLCRKNLHGKDIYMYRGEKAFCSPDCRQCQIVIDERTEQCRSEATRSGEVPTSTYGCTSTGSGSGGGGGGGQIFSPGIVAV